MAAQAPTSILAGRQPRTLQLEMLREELPVKWDRQRERFGLTRDQNS